MRSTQQSTERRTITITLKCQMCDEGGACADQKLRSIIPKLLVSWWSIPDTDYFGEERDLKEYVFLRFQGV